MNKMTKETKTATDFAVICGLLHLVIMIIIMIIVNSNMPNIHADELEVTTETISLYQNTIEIDTYDNSTISETETTIYTEPEITEYIEATVPEIIQVVEETIPETTQITEATTPETKPEKEQVLKYKYGRRMTPAVDIDIPTGDNMRNFTGEVDTGNYKYLGTYKITGYTPKCVHCCGNDKGITASGVEAIAGYTVATHKNLSFGTTLYIEGYGYYVVEDRGNLATNVIDIAATTHESCYNLTNNEVNVYVVPH